MTGTNGKNMNQSQLLIQNLLLLIELKMFDDNDDTPITLTINKIYAKNYETWRGKEEKQKCKISLFAFRNFILDRF